MIFMPLIFNFSIKNEVSKEVEESLYDMELEILDDILDTLEDDGLVDD